MAQVNCIARQHEPRTAKCANCRTPTVCEPFGPEATRRVQEHDLRWSREIGYESARPDLERPDEPTAPARPAGRALLIYAGVVLGCALSAMAIFINL